MMGVTDALMMGLKFPLWLIAAVSGCMSINTPVAWPPAMLKLVMTSMWPGGTFNVSSKCDSPFWSMYVAIADVTPMRILE